MDKAKWLKYYLYLFGLINVCLISFTIPLLFGDLLLWQPRNIPDEMMISGLYLVMGIMMILAARKPLNHKLFVDFVVVANVVHALTMLLYAEHILHILVDVLSMGAMGLLPLLFYPWGLRRFLRYP